MQQFRTVDNRQAPIHGLRTFESFQVADSTDTMDYSGLMMHPGDFVHEGWSHDARLAERQDRRFRAEGYVREFIGQVVAWFAKYRGDNLGTFVGAYSAKIGRTQRMRGISEADSVRLLWQEEVRRIQRRLN